MNQIHRSFLDIDKSKWERLKPEQNPFLSLDFYQTLEITRCIGSQSGWLPQIIEVQAGFLVYFIKDHSYGEYIFDWNWAQAYASHGLDYYPKLLSMCPFTPATKSVFICKAEDKQTQNLNKMNNKEKIFVQ